MLKANFQELFVVHQVPLYLVLIPYLVTIAFFEACLQLGAIFASY